MDVIVEGKVVQREVDYVEVKTGPLFASQQRQIPVITPGERVMHVIGGPPRIVKGPDA